MPFKNNTWLYLEFYQSKQAGMGSVCSIKSVIFFFYKELAGEVKQPESLKFVGLFPFQHFFFKENYLD